MIRQSYTARELFCMAYIHKMKKMYGIPDDFSSMPNDKRHAEIQRISDELIEKGSIEMDMDGSVELQEGCKMMIEFICKCDTCLTVNVQKSQDDLQSYIFWRCAGTYMMAEIIGERYFLSYVDAQTVRTQLEQLWAVDREVIIPEEVIIPQLALIKAKRLGSEGDVENALRILRQNGADDIASQVIMNALIGKAGYMGILLVDNRSGECHMQETCFLVDKGLIYELGSKVVKYRTCAVLSGVEAAAVQNKFSIVVDGFLR